ncbi:hypothetical protein LCGC14_0476090 [marine sediment metagenome]|uniref:Uncharacterized protein n=1 Tax=marine sediment metagenome TaxID=412755 RepID=A0A0F9STQ8_9ZZZZ
MKNPKHIFYACTELAEWALPVAVKYRYSKARRRGSFIPHKEIHLYIKLWFLCFQFSYEYRTLRF